LAISLVLASTVLIGLQGCKWWNGGASTTPTKIAEPKSRIPYPAKEPESYRAIVAVTTGEIVRRAAIAKDRTDLRIDFEIGSERSLTMLRTDRTYVISERKEIYAERASGGAFPAEEFVAEMTTRLLHRTENAEFEMLGYENELAKFRVRLGNSETGENIVYVDEKLGMPVIREFYSINGEARELMYRMELQDISLEVDRSVFELPKNYRKVTADEFYRVTRSVEK
jgi:hypothetical protein